MSNFPIDKVPQEVWDDLRYEIGRADLEYDDNWRAYRYKDKFLFKEFKQAENKGCCGFFNTSTIINGEKWIIGCNYGH